MPTLCVAHGARSALLRSDLAAIQRIPCIREQSHPAATLDMTSVMPRKPRHNIAGGLYHVMNRGNRKASIFDDVHDRRRFLKILIKAMEHHDVQLLAGCQMTNHYHLDVLTPRGNISAFMAELDGEFARYSNTRHRRVGHVFQGRFRDVIIEDDLHLFISLCYIFLNPVVAGMVDTPERCKWSTYAGTVGLAAPPPYVSVAWLERLFTSQRLKDSQLKLRQLLRERDPIAAYLRQCEREIGPETIHRAIRSYVSEQRRTATMLSERVRLRPTID
ncbi:MAG TPA: transposase, partial [Vicinamibacterales bacterium]|nr:transposase [Vicinamibacterales bacterium]